MKYKIIFACSIVFLLLTQHKVHAQMRFDSVLNNYAANYQTEKVYFQLDKPAYGVGDTVWFKGYVMAGITPTEKSKNLYIDFSDVKGKVLAHLVYPIIMGGAFGQFTVPDSLTGKFLHMRGYTNWMRNFDSAFFYEKDIRIIKSDPNVVKVQPKQQTSITFFPEGGNFVAGIKANIAFKATDQFGIPVDVNGEVVDSKNANVGEFKSKHDGMGVFSIFPSANEKYKAIWTDANKVKHETELPNISNSGVVLQLANIGKNKAFLISRTDNVPAEQKELHILATIQQQPVYLANINLETKNSIGGSFDASEMPAGVMIVTILDKNYVPLAERITFVDNLAEAKVEPELGFTKIGLNKRAANEVVVNLPDSNIANLSLSITDAELGIDSSSNIVSQLLMSDDIKGRVYHPLYYFSDTTKEIKNNLELVMMTNGWRKYNWDKIAAGEFPKINYPVDTSYLTLSGKIFGATPDQIRTAGEIILLATPTGQNKNTKFIPMTVKPDGTFNDPNALFFDSLSVRYQFAKKKNFADQVSVKFMNNRILPPLNIFPDKQNLAFLMMTDTSGEARLKYMLAEQYRIAQLAKTKTLEDVTVHTKAKSPLEIMDDKYTSGMFKGGDAQEFNLVNDMVAQTSMNILQYLQGRVAGLQISNPTSNPSMTWRGGTPQIYLDEMPVDVNMIQNMPVTDMAYLKVFRPPFMGGFGGGSGGAIAIYTKRGDERAASSDAKGLPGQLIAGYSSIKEFYVPNYDDLNVDWNKPDLRTTLYWVPSILTGPNNKMVRMKFFNNDYTHSFRVVLEGMASDGRLIHVEKVIE
ncbi:hypothetical protein [Rhizosphaericola mali]|uniref:TonB-dependent receptor plug domain-containing protein n=1 Tax=Rhizosphaericola mali TaxID=2545455 RepID=A0A5P2G485_9BACT|nr:hypothetical protein [Rhizosphaericola mali]QES88632.1 hypothetical protein E0W69_008180 [Rhizosphaericola mali]